MTELCGAAFLAENSTLFYSMLPRQLRANGLRADALRLPDETLRALAEDYTREAGVRSLEREIAALCRSVAVRAASMPHAARAGMHPILAA